MAKKSKKRQLDVGSNGAETKTLVVNDAPKKKKLKTDLSEKQNESSIAAKQNDSKSEDVSQKKKLENATVKKDTNVSTNSVGGKKLKNKNKKAKKQENLGDKTTPSDAKETAPLSKKKEKFIMKREQHKQNIKQKGIKAGPFQALDKYSLEEMKQKITEIESRETISKTSKRRLGILKKKVQVLESEGGKQNLNNQDGLSTVKEHKKDKLQNKINKNTTNKVVDANISTNNKKEKKDNKLKKNLFIEDRVGQRSDDIAEQDNDKLNMEDSDDSDSEASDDQSLDGSEINTKDDTTKVENESSSAESDEDGSEDEDALEQVEKSTDTKMKHTQIKSNQDSNKQKVTEKGPTKKPRYVLFVGNISYESAAVDLKKHFLTKVENVKDVRIPLKPGTNAPRGFAYVEVDNSEDYEKALSLHNSFLNGRKINVQYTASGSKKASRNPEVVHKNKKLQALRNEGKLAGSQKFSNKRSFRRNFKNNGKKDSADREKFPHKQGFKKNFQKKFNKKESQ